MKKIFKVMPLMAFGLICFGGLKGRAMQQSNSVRSYQTSNVKGTLDRKGSDQIFSPWFHIPSVSSTSGSYNIYKSDVSVLGPQIKRPVTPFPFRGI